MTQAIVKWTGEIVDNDLFKNYFLPPEASRLAPGSQALDLNWLRVFARKHQTIPADQFIDFLYQAQRQGADPRNKEVYLVVRNAYNRDTKGYEPTATTVFAYQFFISRAMATGRVAKWEVGTIVEEYYNPVTNQKGAAPTSIARVWLKDQPEPLVYRARFWEFAQKGKDGVVKSWAEKPYLMLEKCAIANAMRWACPEILSGVYIGEEIDAEQARTIELDRSDQTALGATPAARSLAPSPQAVAAGEVVYDYTSTEVPPKPTVNRSAQPQPRSAMPPPPPPPPPGAAMGKPQAPLAATPPPAPIPLAVSTPPASGIQTSSPSPTTTSTPERSSTSVPETTTKSRSEDDGSFDDNNAWDNALRDVDISEKPPGEEIGGTWIQDWMTRKHIAFIKRYVDPFITTERAVMSIASRRAGAERIHLGKSEKNSLLISIESATFLSAQTKDGPSGTATGGTIPDHEWIATRHEYFPRLFNPLINVEGGHTPEWASWSVSGISQARESYGMIVRESPDRQKAVLHREDSWLHTSLSTHNDHCWLTRRHLILPEIFSPLDIMTILESWEFRDHYNGTGGGKKAHEYCAGNLRTYAQQLRDKFRIECGVVLGKHVEDFISDTPFDKWFLLERATKLFAPWLGENRKRATKEVVETFWEFVKACREDDLDVVDVIGDEPDLVVTMGLQDIQHRIGLMKIATEQADVRASLTKKASPKGKKSTKPTKELTQARETLARWITSVEHRKGDPNAIAGVDCAEVVKASDLETVKRAVEALAAWTQARMDAAKQERVAPAEPATESELKRTKDLEQAKATLLFEVQRVCDLGGAPMHIIGGNPHNVIESQDLILMRECAATLKAWRPPPVKTTSRAPAPTPAPTPAPVDEDEYVPMPDDEPLATDDDEPETYDRPALAQAPLHSLPQPTAPKIAVDPSVRFGLVEAVNKAVGNGHAPADALKRLDPLLKDPSHAATVLQQMRGGDYSYFVGR